MPFDAGSIVAKLSLDTTKFTASIKGVKKQQQALSGWVKKNSAQFKRLGVAITAMGVVAIATFKKMINQYVEVGDWIDKMSKRTGFSAVALSELSYAADISGASLENVEKSLKKMSMAIVDANAGLATYLRYFDLLGIEVEDLMGLKPEEQFMKIGSAIADLRDDTEKAAMASQLFGRAGIALLPLFKEGAEGIAKLREEAHLLGIIFDEEAAAKAAKLKDAQTALKKSVQGLSHSIAEEFVPILTRLAKHFTDTVVDMRGDTKGLTSGIVGFLSVIVKGVEGLMLAWHEFQRMVFEGAGLVTKHLRTMMIQLLKSLVLIEKIPIVGSKFKGITDAVWESIKTLTYITDGYNESADKQGETMADLIVFFEELLAGLRDVKTGIKDVKTETKGLGDTIATSTLGPLTTLAQQLNLILSLPLPEKLEKLSHVVTGFSMKLRALTKEQYDQLNVLQQWTSALAGGISGVIQYLKALIVEEIIIALAKSKMPFLMKLGVLIPTMMALNAFTSALEGMLAPKEYAEGGIVGQHGREIISVGERGPEEIIPLGQGGAGVGINRIIIQNRITIGEQTFYKETVKNVNKAGQRKDIVVPVSVVV